jgi:hypothetical protein
VAESHVSKGRDWSTLGAVYEQISGGNASAAKQAVAELTITTDGDKPRSVRAYWGKVGGASPAIDLKVVDL